MLVWTRKFPLILLWLLKTDLVLAVEINWDEMFVMAVSQTCDCLWPERQKQILISCNCLEMVVPLRS